MIKKFFGMLCLISINSLFCIQAQNQSFVSIGYQQIQVGDINLVVLTDGSIQFPAVQPIMAPDADPGVVTDILKNNFLPTENFGLGMNVMLLQKGNHLILFDSGIGYGAGEAGGHLVANLKQIGISPEQITDIVITHAHSDHIGGLLDKSGNSIYKNAVMYISDIEYDFWTSENPDFSGSKLNGDPQLKESAKAASATLKAIKSQLKFVKDGDSILDCMKVILAPGHTAGHIVTEIYSKDESLFHIADIVHYSALLFLHPEWGTIFDWNFDLGVKTRIKTFELLSQNKALVFGYHLPYPGVGHIKKKADNSFEWIPKPFLTPNK